MTRKLAATVEIGAALSSGFGKAFQDADTRIKEFGSSIKAFREAGDNITELIQAQTALKAAQANNNAELREYGKLLRLKNWKRNAEDTAKYNANLAAQKAKVEASRAALDRQQTTVRKLGATLRAAGVDTNKLSEENERLAKSAEEAKKKQAMMASIKGLNLGVIGNRLLPALMLRFPKFGQMVQNVAPTIANYLPLIGAIGTLVAGMTAAIGAAVLGIFKLGKSFSDYVENLRDSSDGLGTTIEGLAALRWAANKAGIETEKLDTYLSRFQQTLQDAADGGKESGRAFKELGLDPLKLQAMDAEEAMNLVADAFKNYKGRMSEAALAQQLFGKGSSKLVGLLKKGSGELDVARAQAVEKGLIPSKEQQAQSAKFDETTESWSAWWRGKMNTVGTFASKMVTGFDDWMTMGQQDYQKTPAYKYLESRPSFNNPTLKQQGAFKGLSPWSDAYKKLADEHHRERVMEIFASPEFKALPGAEQVVQGEMNRKRTLGWTDPKKGGVYTWAGVTQSVTVNINQQPGQDSKQLAKDVAEALKKKEEEKGVLIDNGR
jgi:hypothetical protein